jgi:hypothetical protein
MKDIPLREKYSMWPKVLAHLKKSLYIQSKPNFFKKLLWSNLMDRFLINFTPKHAELSIFWLFIYSLCCKCRHRNVLSKRQVWMSIFHIINFKKKNSWTQGSWIFVNKKLILDYYFCLKSGPVFLFQIFIIAMLFKYIGKSKSIFIFFF